MTNDPLEALDYIKRYFELVYKAEALDSNEVETFTNRLPEISHEQNSLLTKEISTEEIMEVINSLPANKSPGPDELTYNFYKTFIEEVTPILKGIFNNALNTGVIPVSWKKSIITLIPKKEEALHDIGNWRPISLINADAKIFTKIMANRLNPLCNEVVGEYQQGFIRSRSIVDAALNIISTMRGNKNQETPDWLVFLD